jgi:hypothetical protein
MTIETLATAGGLFVLLGFNHFVVDWVFQTHREAMRKSSNWRYRARHCLVYTVGFIPIMLLMGLVPWELAAGAAILFFSHFIEDTYIPVYLWARYIRRIPGIRLDGIQAFKSEFTHPLGLMLFVAIDQIIHLLFLFPLIYFALV